MSKSKLLSDLRKAYVRVLAEHNKVYHFDDAAEEIIGPPNGELIFTQEEAEVVNTISAALHDDELFDLAIAYVNSPVVPAGPMKNQIGMKVLDTLQGLEEIGGVGDTEEYIDVLETIYAEVAARLAASKKLYEDERIIEAKISVLSDKESILKEVYE